MNSSIEPSTDTKYRFKTELVKIIATFARLKRTTNQKKKQKKNCRRLQYFIEKDTTKLWCMKRKKSESKKRKHYQNKWCSHNILFLLHSTYGEILIIIKQREREKERCGHIPSDVCVE